jgi:hypothetical protein
MRRGERGEWRMFRWLLLMMVYYGVSQLWLGGEEVVGIVAVVHGLGWRVRKLADGEIAVGTVAGLEAKRRSRNQKTLAVKDRVCRTHCSSSRQGWSGLYCARTRC